MKRDGMSIYGQAYIPGDGAGWYIMKKQQSGQIVTTDSVAGHVVSD
ncbi:hypothetical protein GCM10010916_05220 [Paenibacillus abyssi]|uniref:Uncharacterized protein n=1 Tax=Paenibacillus abyssi TaxID=1340531 RepID=A0A917CJH9_9BACL|nr:hypothetical protein GCM10010916_05220 [Paenibacillus abyssi]